jgi:hypothetical protein
MVRFVFVFRFRRFFFRRGGRFLVVAFSLTHPLVLPLHPKQKQTTDTRQHVEYAAEQAQTAFGKP